MILTAKGQAAFEGMEPTPGAGPDAALSQTTGPDMAETLQDMSVVDRHLEGGFATFENDFGAFYEGSGRGSAAEGRSLAREFYDAIGEGLAAVYDPTGSAMQVPENTSNAEETVTRTFSGLAPAMEDPISRIPETPPAETVDPANAYLEAERRSYPAGEEAEMASVAMEDPWASAFAEDSIGLAKAYERN